MVKNNTKSRAIIITGIVIVLVAGILIIMGLLGGDRKEDYIDPATGNLVISTDKLTETATFYPVEVNNIKLEVLALKASDGTIRTAFNTCQVCYGSGRGYYKLDGSTLVCQNCGNRFSPDQVELEKGGCNPVPVTPEYKQEQDGQIIITKDFLEQASVIFQNWKA